MANASARVVYAKDIDNVELQLCIDDAVSSIRHFDDGGQYALHVDGQLMGYGNVWSPNRAEYEWEATPDGSDEAFPVMLTLVRKYTLLSNKVEITLRVSGYTILHETV